MKQVSEMPTGGQFVAVWKFNGAIWSNTYKIQDGKIYEFIDEGDCFVLQSLGYLAVSGKLEGVSDINFFIAD